MADQQLRVRLTAQDDGTLKASIDSTVNDINRVNQAVVDNASRTTSAAQQSATAMEQSSGRISSSLRTIAGLLASNQITQLTGDYVNFGSVVSAIFAGRLVGDVAEYSKETVNSVKAVLQQREAILANAAAATALHERLAANYAATIAAGEASTIYGQRLRENTAASLVAAEAARAQAAEMTFTRTIFSILGGPEGIITAASSALALWASSSRAVAQDNHQIAISMQDINAAYYAFDGIAPAAAHSVQQLAERITLLQAAMAHSTNANYATALQKQIDGLLEVIRKKQAADEHLRAILNPPAPPAPPKLEDANAQVAAFAEYQTTLAGINDALTDQYAKLTLTDGEYEKFTLANKGLNAAAQAAALQLWGVNQALLAQQKTVARGAAALADARADLYPEATAAQKYADDVQAVTAYMQAQHASVAEIDQAVTDLALDYSKKMTPAAQAAADETAQIFKDTATGIRDDFRQTFLDIFDNGLSGMKNLGTEILDTFKKTLADMATLAIARPIIVPVVSILGSLLGVPATAQASVLAQLGGPVAAGTSTLAGFGNFGTGSPPASRAASPPRASSAAWAPPRPAPTSAPQRLTWRRWPITMPPMPSPAVVSAIAISACSPASVRRA